MRPEGRDERHRRVSASDTQSQVGASGIAKLFDDSVSGKLAA